MSAAGETFERGLARAVAANATWLIADRVARLGIGLFVGVWVARYLGPERFGQISFAAAFCTLFSSIGILGLNNILVREFVRFPDKTEALLTTALALRVCGGLVAFALPLAIVFFLRSEEGVIQWLVGVTAAAGIFQASEVIDFWFQSQIRVKLVAVARFSAFAAAAGLKIYLIFAGASVIAFATAGVIESLAGAAAVLVAYRIVHPTRSFASVDKTLARQLLADGWPLMLSGIVTAAYMRIDQILLGTLANVSEVGRYAAAVVIAEGWYFLPASIVTSLFPVVIAAKDRDESQFVDRLQHLYRLMAFIGFSFAVPVTLLANPIMRFVYGSDYESGGTALAILAWCGLFAGLGLARTTFLTAMNWTRLHLALATIGCCVSVALSWLLIPRMQGVGAAVAALSGQIAAVYFSCYLFPSLRRTGQLLTRAMLVPLPRLW